MGQQRRDHYIPQFLLRQFAQVNKPQMLFRLDLNANMVRPAQVRTEAQRNGLYTIPPDAAEQIGMDPRELERCFQSIESRAAPALKRLVTPGLPFGEQDRIDLAFLLAAQLVRTPRRRAWRQNLQRPMMDAWLQMRIGDTDLIRDAYFADREVPDAEVAAKQQELFAEVEAGNLRIEMDDGVAAVAHAIVGIDALMLPVLNETRWVLARTPKHARLVLGDDPAVLFDPTPKLPGAGNGPLSSDNSETVLPVSPTAALVLFPGSGEMTKRTMTVEQVEEINLRSYAWATSALYGQAREDLLAARRLAAREPERLEQVRPRPPRMWISDTNAVEPAASSLSSVDGDGVRRLLRGVGLRFDDQRAA